MFPCRAFLSLRQQATSTAASRLSSSSSSRVLHQNQKHLSLRSLFSSSPSSSLSNNTKFIISNGGCSIPRSFSTRPMMHDSSSNRPPKETILLEGCDYEHWLVVVETPDPNLTRDEIIDSYIKTLAQVLGSEEEARKQIYSVSTKHYFAFSCIVSEDISYKIKELPGVRWVLPDSYLDVRNKDYGGEPFIDGRAVPYDPKYHELWVKNHNNAVNKNRNGRPRNNDRSRNFERRRENMMNGNVHPSPSSQFQRHKPPMMSPNVHNQAPPSPMPNRNMQPTVQNQDFSNGVMPPPAMQNQNFSNSGMSPPMQNQNFSNRNMPPPQMQNQNFSDRGMPPPPVQNQNFSNRDMPPPMQTQNFSNRGMPQPMHNQNNWDVSPPPPPQQQPLYNQGYQNNYEPPQQNWNQQGRQMPPPETQAFHSRDMSAPAQNSNYQSRDASPAMKNGYFQTRGVPPPPIQNRDMRTHQMRDVPENDFVNVANRNF